MSKIDYWAINKNSLENFKKNKHSLEDLKDKYLVSFNTYGLEVVFDDSDTYIVDDKETAKAFAKESIEDYFEPARDPGTVIVKYLGDNNFELIKCSGKFKKELADEFEKQFSEIFNGKNITLVRNNSDAVDAYVEALHPEIDLPWRGEGKRHPVDADTFTNTKKGDIVSVHVSDDLPDIKYRVKDGDYLDKEARDKGEWGKDTAVEYQELNTSEFNDALTNKIKRAVSKAAEDTLKNSYKKDFKTYFGGSSGNVPIDVCLTNSNSDRKIPAIYDDKDSILESDSTLSDKIDDTRRETLALALGCSKSDIKPDFSNIQLLNCEDEDEFREVYGEDEPIRPDYPYGWTDKETWNNFAKKYPENN